MPKEKPYFRDVVAEIKESTGKTILGVNDIKKYINRGYNTAIKFLDGQKTITVQQFAIKLLEWEG